MGLLARRAVAAAGMWLYGFEFVRIHSVSRIEAMGAIRSYEFSGGGIAWEQFIVGHSKPSHHVMELGCANLACCDASSLSRDARTLTLDSRSAIPSLAHGVSKSPSNLNQSPVSNNVLFCHCSPGPRQHLCCSIQRRVPLFLLTMQILTDFKQISHFPDIRSFATPILVLGVSFG